MITGDFFDHIKFGSTAWLNRWNDFFGAGVMNLNTSGPPGFTGDFALSYPSTPNMTISDVGVGTAWTAGYRVHNDDQTPTMLTFAPADPTNPRIDLVQVGPLPISSINILLGVTQNMGQVTVKTGTPAASPVQPTPDNILDDSGNVIGAMVPLYAVAVAANQTSVTSANITDLRVIVPFYTSDANASNFLLKTGDSMTSGTIGNIPTPVSSLQAANKEYVDAIAAGLQRKAMVQVVATSNITLSGEQTIDGVLTSGSRVLVAGQTGASANGIYVSAAGAWSRSSDANTGALLVNAYVFVLDGTDWMGSYWLQTTPATITVGSSAIDWITESVVTGFLPLSGGSMTGAINEDQGTDIASASTTNIAAATGNFVRVTGAATITALGTAQAGTRREVEFTGACSLTYNATSLILPGAASISVQVGDTATFISLGVGDWICSIYQRASGQPLVSSGGGAAPTGTMAMFINTTPPSGWLTCNGQAVSQALYPALFALIGTTYGPAAGGNFTLPDLQSRVPVGYAPSSPGSGRSQRLMGAVGGEETHTLTIPELAAHTHTISANAMILGSHGTETQLQSESEFGVMYHNAGVGDAGDSETSSTGTNTAHNNMEPFVVVNYIIKT